MFIMSGMIGLIHPLSSITFQRIILPLFRLNPVQGATFDEGGARASNCMPGIRVDVIETIKKKWDPKTPYTVSMPSRDLESKRSHGLSP